MNIKDKILRLIGHTYLRSSAIRQWKTPYGIMRYPLSEFGGLGVTQRTLGLFERKVFKAIKKKVKIPPNTDVINLGGCYGDYAIFLAKITKQKNPIYVFEPIPFLFRFLVNNIKLNGYKDIIHPVNGAVGGKSGFIIFDDNIKPDSVQWYSQIRQSYTVNSGGLSSLGLLGNKRKQVPIIKLSDFILQNKLNPSFIMMDIEGFELVVLDDLVRYMKDKEVYPLLLIETHSNYPFFHSLKPNQYLEKLDQVVQSVNYSMDYIDEAHILLKPNF